MFLKHLSLCEAKTNRMKYAAPLDKTSKIITLLISLLFIIIIALQIVLFVQYKDSASVIIAAFLFVIYVVPFCYHPVSYQIKNNNIVVHRYASDVVLHRSEIKNIELVSNQKLKGAIRTFGVGGMYGYFGQFLNSDLGCMTWYATQRDSEAILIEMNNHKKIIITPDKPEQFLQQLQQAA